MSVPTNLIGKRVGNSRIELVALLGEGSYGAVYRGILHRGGLRTSKQYAVKVQYDAIDAHQRRCLDRELELHARVSDGDGIVTLYDTFKEGPYVFMVIKFCPEGDLWGCINRGYFLGDDALIKDVYTQILDSVAYCHSKSVYHRDIKPENILLSNGGHRVLLADFGLATGDPTSTEMRLGSPWYMSPECWGSPAKIWEDAYSSVANDVWSLGILLINLAAASHAPWRCAHQRDAFFRDFTKQPNLLRLFVPLSPAVHDILARVFVAEAAGRISLRELRAAVRGVRHFAVPAACRAAYRDYQRAVWRAAVGPSPSRPLSLRDAASATAAASRASSADSGGPATPAMPAAQPDVDVPELAALAPGRAVVVAVKPPRAPPKALCTPRVDSWGGILDAIRAM